MKKKDVTLLFIVLSALFLLAVPVEAQNRLCGPQPISPCFTFQCVNGNWKVTTHPGVACTVAGQHGICTFEGLPQTQSVYCAGPYRVDVTVSGLNSGNSVVLLENNHSSLSVSANGASTFPSGFFSGDPYTVTVQTQPAGQVCAVGNGSGTVNGANPHVTATCLSTSVWTPIGPAPVGIQGPGQGGNAGRVNVAAADPTNAATIFLGGGGVWSTSNAFPGMTTPSWQPLTDNVAAPQATPSGQASMWFGYPHSLSVHPANHNLIQAAVSYAGGGILRSNQGGAPGSWTLTGSPQFEQHSIGAIAVNPTNTQITYAVTDMGLFQTQNGGQTWTLVGGLPTSGVSDVIVARFDPTGNTLFVAVAGNGVYRSTNGGGVWTPLTTLPNAATAYSLQMDSGSSGALYVTMLTTSAASPPVNAVQRFTSLNQGNTWTALSPTPGVLESRSWHLLIAVDPDNDKHVFVNDAYSLYETTTGGQSVNGAPAWTEADVPQTSGHINYDWTGVSFDANGKVLATADQGIFRYDPSGTVGQNWDSLNGNLEVVQFYTITPSSQTIAGIAQDEYFAFFANSPLPNAVWQSIGSGGETGKVLLPPAGASYAYIYNPLSDGNFDLIWRTQITPQMPLQQSSQWTPIFTKNVYSNNNYGLAYSSQKAFVMDPFNSRHLMVGVDQVYETTNADYTTPAPTWNPIGPCVLAGEQPFVTAIAIAPSDPVYVYAATSDGHTWVTKTDGQSSDGQPCDGWTENDNGLNGNVVISMSVDPRNPQHVFAATATWGGTWELGLPSATGQQTWQNRSGPNGVSLYSILVDWMYSPAHLYIGTDRGVYNSNNLGASWTPFGSGLPNEKVNDLQSIPLISTPPTSLLLAASYGRGAFEILLAEPLPPPPPRPPLPIPGRPKWIPPLQPPWGEGQPEPTLPRLPATTPKP